MTFKLDPLPYSYEALDPAISSETLHYHHDKHHKAYVDTLNEVIRGTKYEDEPLANIIEFTFGKTDKPTKKIFNNASQVWNHDFLWKSMAPYGSEHISHSLEIRLEKEFGGLEAFKDSFIKMAKDQFASGWVWVILNDKKLEIIKTSNAMNPLAFGYFPLVCCDVWEHAYYLDYQNDRADHVKQFLDHIINWEFMEHNIDKALNYAEEE